MRSRLLIFVAAVIAIGFLMFAFTRTVGFTEKAVIQTFGGASERSVVDEPGLVFRWPAPIQRVTVYDTRARLLTTRSETQQTADNRQIVVEAFLTWRVSDPLKFLQRFGSEGSEERRHYAAAERTLQAQLRSAMSEVSRYRLDELFTPTPGGSRLGDLEQAIASRLQSPMSEGASVAEWGVEPMVVGINRIVLPEDTTKDVFERMKATRQRLASEAESRGQADANTIRASADSAARRILAFAESRAAEIRNRGDEEATRYIALLNEEPRLAVFLEQVEFLRELLGRRTTLVISTTMTGMSVLHPALLSFLGAESLPPFTLDSSSVPVGGERAVTEAPQDGDEPVSTIGAADGDSPAATGGAPQ